MLRRQLGQRHDRDHRIDSGGRRQSRGVPDPDALRVVQLSSPVPDRCQGIRAEAARAHLVGRVRDALPGGARKRSGECLEVVACPPARVRAGERCRSPRRRPRDAVRRAPRAPAPRRVGRPRPAASGRRLDRLGRARPRPSRGRARPHATTRPAAASASPACGLCRLARERMPPRSSGSGSRTRRGSRCRRRRS